MKLALRHGLIGIVLLMVIAVPIARLSVRAQESAVVRGLSLSPFIFEEKLQKGQQVERNIYLHNNTNGPLRVSFNVTDFKANQDDSGQPVFVGPGETMDANYALSSWITVTAPPPAVLAPGQRAAVTVLLAVPAAAEEGSRYGAVLFSYAGNGELGTFGSQVIKKAGTLFFVKVGTAQEQGSVTHYAPDKKIYTQPLVEFSTKFENTGNVHLKPKGFIGVYNMFGRQVATVQVNRDAGIVLPKTTRGFSAVWQPRWALGRYVAQLKYVYGDNKLESVAKVTFWIIPIKSLIVALLGLLVLVYAVWRGIRRYNAWLVKKA